VNKNCDETVGDQNMTKKCKGGERYTLLTKHTTTGTINVLKKMIKNVTRGMITEADALGFAHACCSDTAK
jgi:hypothetical protein